MKIPRQITGHFTRHITRHLTRRTATSAIALSALLMAVGASAQSFPDRPIKLVVPFGAGSFPDIVARVVSEKMSVGLSQPVVVENRLGAGGNVGTEVVVKARPDGYTLLLHSVANATSKALFGNLSFDPLKDLKPITQFAAVGNVLVVNPALPANNLAELLELAKKRPNGLSYASGGNGTTAHLAVELLRSTTRANFVHVPYTNFGQALTDVMGGQADFVMPNRSTRATPRRTNSAGRCIGCPWQRAGPMRRRVLSWRSFSGSSKARPFIRHCLQRPGFCRIGDQAACSSMLSAVTEKA